MKLLAKIFKNSRGWRILLFVSLGVALVSGASALSEKYNYAEQEVVFLQFESEKLATDLKFQKVRFAAEFQEAIVRRIARSYNPYLSPDVEQEIVGTIISVSKQYRINPLLITAIIETESHFNNYARSYMGARGLMQVMPTTGREIAKQLGIPWRGVRTLHEPANNIRIGTYYFARLLKRYSDPFKALTAYNQGPGYLNYRLSRGYKISRRYGKKVLRAFNKHTRSIPLFA